MPELKHVLLMKFKPEELMFDEDDTKEVLKFFFPNQSTLIEQAETIRDDVRSFSQALMVEAVDASYALGYVKIVYDVFYMKPPAKFGKALAEFGKKAAPHWFKHATAKDLTNVKIYDAVRASIARNFRTVFEEIIAGTLAMDKPIVAVIAYSKKDEFNKTQVWVCL